MLTVHGTYLTSVQQPKIFAVFNHRKSQEMVRRCMFNISSSIFTCAFFVF